MNKKTLEENNINLEKHLAQSRKMEAIGTFAGGIAHDFNNILSGIVGYSEVALLLAEKDDQISNILNKILEACERARSLITVTMM